MGEREKKQKGEGGEGEPEKKKEERRSDVRDATEKENGKKDRSWAFNFLKKIDPCTSIFFLKKWSFPIIFFT